MNYNLRLIFSPSLHRSFVGFFTLLLSVYDFLISLYREMLVKLKQTNEEIKKKRREMKNYKTKESIKKLIKRDKQYINYQ